MCWNALCTFLFTRQLERRVVGWERGKRQEPRLGTVSRRFGSSDGSWLRRLRLFQKYNRLIRRHHTEFSSAWEKALSTLSCGNAPVSFICGECGTEETERATNTTTMTVAQVAATPAAFSQNSQVPRWVLAGCGFRELLLCWLGTSKRRQSDDEELFGEFSSAFSLLTSERAHHEPGDVLPTICSSFRPS